VKSKAIKSGLINDYQQTIASSIGIIFADYQGMTVSEITELRSQLRENSLKFTVVKNTLAKIAAKNTPLEGADDIFKGPLAIAVSDQDPVILAKTILEYSKQNEKLEVKGGVIEGKVCNTGDLKKLSELPSREVLLATMAGTFQSPLSQLARLLNATIVRFVYALEGLKEKKEKE
jgi:large subunit ribosomal protein L10